MDSSVNLSFIVVVRADPYLFPSGMVSVRNTSQIFILVLLLQRTTLFFVLVFGFFFVLLGVCFWVVRFSFFFLVVWGWWVGGFGCCFFFFGGWCFEVPSSESSTDSLALFLLIVSRFDS